MTKLQALATSALLCLSSPLAAFAGDDSPSWPQWAQNAQHTGMVQVQGQPLNAKLADIIYDPFVLKEQAENLPVLGEADLTVHYESVLVDQDSFYMLQKGGQYNSCQPTGYWLYGFPCGPNSWNTMRWSVVRYNWSGDTVTTAWSYLTDWKPVPNGTNLYMGVVGLVNWEPVFHPALANNYLYVPGAGGTLWKVDKSTGLAVSHINPFQNGSVDPASTYVSGPLTVSDSGSLYYNVIEFNPQGNPWANDISGAWLVKVAPDDTTATVSYADLVPGAPAAGSTSCPGTFADSPNGYQQLPWPPLLNSTPPTLLCGSQRPPINAAPAVAPDGTVYTVSIANFDSMVSYLVAVQPDLTPKWASSMQHRLKDGCGVLLPIAPPGVTNLPNSCRNGTPVGFDPTTNTYGSATVLDQASSTPTVLPDGSVLYPATDNYNYGRGHLFHFDAQGNYLNAYTFGYDVTAGVYQHDGTYSIIVKDNHYSSAAYCFDPSNPVCTPVPEGPYYVTQLDSNLQVEWSFQSISSNAQHPNGYEWCVNAPVIDSAGLVYVTSEDGNVYSIPQGHHGVFTTPHQKIFLKEALGAAYTPLSIGPDGRIYSQNDGHLYVIGEP